MVSVAPAAVPLPSLTAGPHVRVVARGGVLAGVAVLLALGMHLSSTVTTLVGGGGGIGGFGGILDEVLLLALAGVSGAWLGGRWLGCPWASLASGVAWQFAVAPALVGELRTVLALVLWPLALGLVVRAVARPELAARVVAGLAGGALLAAAPPHGGGAIVALVLVATVAGGGGAVRDGASASLFTAGLAVLVALPALTLNASFRVPPHAPLGTWALDALAGLGALGLARHRALPRRILFPGVLALAGALPLPALLRGAPLLPLAVALGVGGLVVGLPAYRGTRRPAGSTSQVGGPSSKS